jgi:hypothetical protein
MSCRMRHPCGTHCSQLHDHTFFGFPATRFGVSSISGLGGNQVEHSALRVSHSFTHITSTIKTQGSEERHTKRGDHFTRLRRVLVYYVAFIIDVMRKWKRGCPGSEILSVHCMSLEMRTHTMRVR